MQSYLLSILLVNIQDVITAFTIFMGIAMVLFFLTEKETLSMRKVDTNEQNTASIFLIKAITFTANTLQEMNNVVLI